MRIPEKIMCDLCEQEIKGGAPHAHVTIPMTKQQIDRLIEANKRVTTPPPASILNLAELAYHAMPKVITLEIHTECLAVVGSVFQDAGARVLEQIIAEGIKRHERRQAALEAEA